MKTNLLLGTALVLPLLVGCDESFSPGELAGVYRLTTVEGDPLPHLELATTECDRWVVDGVLVLEASGTHTLVLNIELDCTRGGGQVTQEDRSYQGTFTVDGDRLEFTSSLYPGEILEFEGQAEESAVDVDLPSVVVGLDPILDIRFEEADCPDVCPA